MMSVISSDDLSTSLRIQYRITLKTPLVKNDAKSLEGIEGSITVGSIEPSTASFVKAIDAKAVIADIIGSSVLAFVMGKISLRRIPNMSLTDINKA